MLFVPTALILASEAQRRQVAGARLDGPVVDGRHHRRSLLPARFTRSAGTVASHGRRFAPRPA